jgi:hypothetical protein
MNKGRVSKAKELIDGGDDFLLRYLNEAVASASSTPMAKTSIPSPEGRLEDAH